MLKLPPRIAFEAFRIDHFVDANGRYLLELNPGFPFSIKPFSFPLQAEYALNWHERLELFVPIEGKGEFRMGEKRIWFGAGDVLIVENMKLHGISSFRGKRRKALAISFLPEFVYSLGSPYCDFTFLAPFYSDPAHDVRIVRHSDHEARAVHAAINRLLERYFLDSEGTIDQAGCRLYLLELLYWLSRRFRVAEREHSEYLRQQQRLRRLAKLLEYIQTNYAEHISIDRGAEMTSMSASRFMRFFKETAGMTFVSYITHVRLIAASNLLRDVELNIGEVSAAVGFPDQSYFGRVFRKQFGLAPRDFRNRKVRMRMAGLSDF